MVNRLSVQESLTSSAVTDPKKTLNPNPNTQCAVQVQQRCQELQLDLVETDFAVLLEGCQHGATWGQASALLLAMTRELTALQPSTVAAAEAFFRSASSFGFHVPAPV